mgnify:CR=1 FL=1
MIKDNKLNTKPDDKQECPEWIYITQDITDQFYQIVTEKYKHKPDPINTLIKKHFIERDTSSIDNIKSIKDKEKILEVYNTLTEEEKAKIEEEKNKAQEAAASDGKDSKLSIGIGMPRQFNMGPSNNIERMGFNINQLEFVEKYDIGTEEYTVYSYGEYYITIGYRG